MAEYAHQECCMEAGSTFRIRLTDKCKRIFWSRPANFSHVRQSIFRSSMTYEANCRSQTPNLECKEHNKKNNDFSFFSKANTHQKYYFAYGKTMVRMKCTADKWVKTSSENCGFSTLKHVAVKKKNIHNSQYIIWRVITSECIITRDVSQTIDLSTVERMFCIKPFLCIRSMPLISANQPT